MACKGFYVGSCSVLAVKYWQVFVGVAISDLQAAIGSLGDCL